MITTTPNEKYRNLELEQELGFDWDEYLGLGFKDSFKYPFTHVKENDYIMEVDKRQKLDVAYDEDLAKKQAEVKAEKAANREEKLANDAIKREESHKLHCPNCGSTELQLAGDNKKNFSGGKAVLGGATLGILTGGIGIVAGAGAGFAGKKGKKNVFVCMNCGKNVEVNK